jgi:hypothetical protein
MKTKNICRNCSTQLQSGQQICSVCGALVDTRDGKVISMECETHPDRCAVGLCVICSRPVCSDCAVKSGGKILCADPEHRIVFQGWAVLHRPDSEFEADALVCNLADAGIEAKTFSLHDHVAAHWLKENRILVFVKNPENEKATVLLHELKLIGSD